MSVPAVAPVVADLAMRQRQGLLDVLDLAADELTVLLSRLRATGADTETVVDALMDLLPALGDQYGDAAAYLAAEWYDEARDVAAARGTFMAAPTGGPDRARWEALARWGVDPLRADSPDWQAALALVRGGLERTVADRHRLTIVDNSMRDPQARGWQRVGVAGHCRFCRMLIDRGGVYTDASVTFRSHDNCRCVASPTWDPRLRVVSREPYRQSERHRTEEQRAANRKRAKAYMASMDDDD